MTEWISWLPSPEIYTSSLIKYSLSRIKYRCRNSYQSLAFRGCIEHKVRLVEEFLKSWSVAWIRDKTSVSSSSLGNFLRSRRLLIALMVCDTLIILRVEGAGQVPLTVACYHISFSSPSENTQQQSWAPETTSVINFYFHYNYSE